MSKSAHWEGRIGRRVRLRDLHVLFAVVQHGSMAKAGGHLGVSQSAVSQAIAALEDALQVPLLDRSPRGVEPTIYGAALIRRGQAAFDELRLGVKDIESLADPGSGEVRIACTESIAAGMLPAVIDSFTSRYPRVKLHVSQTTTHLMGFAALHDRSADVVITLLPRPFERDLTEHLQAEVIFNDRICLVTGEKSSWGRGRKISTADLASAPLISPSLDTPGGMALVEAFRAAGLPAPSIAVTTFSVHLRNILSLRGRFVAVLPASILKFNPDLHSLKELAVDLPMHPLPVLIVTLKGRTLGPSVEQFLGCTRDIAKAAYLEAPSVKPHGTSRSALR
jgi:DNA-binding transcriptional LysR family regulator